MASRPKQDLEALAAQLPRSAGVYLFKGPKNRVLYVGKAINLRARVRQYLRGHDARTMVPYLVRQAIDLEVVLTATEKEALLLENTLIKQHRPRFNVKLRDDSGFLHLRLHPKTPWPRYTLVRQLRDDGARYFGPYASASRARKTLDFLQRAFPLRSCTDAVLRSRKRPCLLHQMGRCVAPCVPGVEEEDYRELLRSSFLLLEGRQRPLIQQLERKMKAASDDLRYEAAARHRDLIRTLEASLEQQQVIDTRRADRDLWGLFRSGSQGALVIVPVREGVMGQPRGHTLPACPESNGELLSSLLNNNYLQGSFIPPEILVPERPDDADAIEELLGERRGKRVRIVAPQRGAKRRLLALAMKNAALRFEQDNDQATRLALALEDLARILKLPGPPARMECFDNSNLQGSSPVAAMAVFLDGRPAREEYRRYKIKTVVGADDYASMREILGRRFRRILEEGSPRPDLVVIDGGHGQLGAARAALQDLGLHDQPMIGISKPRGEHRKGQRSATDKLVLPDIKDPIRLPAHSPALRIVQHLRDETHNHAIRYHRKVRNRDTVLSVLDAIDGVGPTRRKALLRALGSASGVAAASESQLTEVAGIGPALAAIIYTALHPS